MSTIKDRNDTDLTEAEDIKKRWKEYTELHKKDLHDPDNPDDVITHLEPDILVCEVKRLFSSSSLYAIRVVSSAYLRFLIFFPATLIPACASSSPAFLMM